MNFLKILDEKLEEYFLVATIIVMVVLIFMQVVMRYIFGNSITWSEELARYIFLWQIWVGAAFAVKRSRHIRVEMLRDALAPKTIERIATIIWLFFCIFLTIKSTEVTNLVLGSGQLTPALRISMAIPYASVPVGSALMVLRLIQKIYYDFKTPVEREVKS